MGYYTCVIVLSWFALAVLCILVYENNRLRSRDKRMYYLTFALIAVAALSEWLGVLFSGNPSIPSGVILAVKTADYILTPSAGVVLIGKMPNKRFWKRIAMGVLMLNTVFQLVAVFFGWTTVVDAENRYAHGPLYWIYAVMYIAVVLLVTIEFIAYGRRFRRQNRLSTYATVALMIAGITLQEMFGGAFRTSYLAMTLSAALLFIHELEFSQLRTDDELQDQRIQTLLSQIQPHFLFNSLSVIQATYRLDVEKGEEAITQFAQYLRHNMDSLTEEEPIAFGQELEHVNRYLALQKLRFGDELTVEYDLRTENFRMPTLTLQPIVENAITYGARRHPERRGRVAIMTRNFSDRVEVEVRDNGPGILPEGDENGGPRSHVGLTNVRERLRHTCGGDLMISSVEGQGTSVTIILPKAEFQRD